MSEARRERPRPRSVSEALRVTTIWPPFERRGLTQVLIDTSTPLSSQPQFLLNDGADGIFSNIAAQSPTG